ncbi:hypothetical protein AB0N20_22745 [Streptomyces griseoincarnatus]
MQLTRTTTLITVSGRTIPQDTHSVTRDDGRPGCTSCTAPATRWITYDVFNGRKRIDETFCDSHGSWLLDDHGRRVTARPATPAA